MDCLVERNAPGFRDFLKAHTFRALTSIGAWALVVAAYYQMPEILTSAQRLMQQGIEAIGDQVPSPWRYGWIVFREMGGVIWLQITVIILTVRILVSTIAATSRFFGKTSPSRYDRMSDPVALAVYSVLTLAFFVLVLVLLAA